ncbi:MAG: hypothetical protein F4203_06290 [Rhodobacteraceae bacterium]|nr:hypothetical protein [Paracoccaceae bacterium]
MHPRKGSLHQLPTQDKLTQWFMERARDGHGRSRKRIIVALVRKLLVALWRLTPLTVEKGPSRSLGCRCGNTSIAAGP